MSNISAIFIMKIKIQHTDKCGAITGPQTGISKMRDVGYGTYYYSEEPEFNLFYYSNYL
jgi:hypothetical protein